MSCVSCMYYVSSRSVDVVTGKKVMVCQKNKETDLEKGCKYHKFIVTIFDTVKQVERPSNRKERRDMYKNRKKVVRLVG